MLGTQAHFWTDLQVNTYANRMDPRPQLYPVIAKILLASHKPAVRTTEFEVWVLLKVLDALIHIVTAVDKRSCSWAALQHVVRAQLILLLVTRHQVQEHFLQRPSGAFGRVHNDRLQRNIGTPGIDSKRAAACETREQHQSGTVRHE